jgi:cystathionine beta-lyase/cystathionine gamma-synthase
MSPEPTTPPAVNLAAPTQPQPELSGPISASLRVPPVGPFPTGKPDWEPHPDTMAITAGRKDNNTALAPILWASTAFETPTLAEGRKMAKSTQATKFYSRYGNPTVRAFEDAVAELEGAESARAFSSGMGAITAVVLGLVSSGQHIVAQRQLYGGTYQLLTMVCPRFGIDVTFVDATKPGAFAEAIIPGRTMLIIAESPANPRLDLVDLDELGALIPITMVDSTFATPLGCNPLAHGVNLVVHSATKAMAGHNDASLGVVAGERELIDWLWGFAVLQGANASPFDALNGLRGLRTLAVRLRQQSATALSLAKALEAHEAVTEVRYPGLPSHPQFELAQRQLRSHGGLVTFDVGTAAAGERLVDALKLCRAATSLGGPETLVTHPVSTTHAGLDSDELVASGITPGTIRVSAGLEYADDVIADILTALEWAVAEG